MKVYEILSEAAPPPGPVPAGMHWNGSMFVPGTAPAQPQAAAPAQSKASADSKARRVAHANKVKDITTPPKIVRQLGRHTNRRKAEYLKKTARADAIKASYLGKLGKAGEFFIRWAGLLEPVYQLWQTVSGLEDDYKNGMDYDGHPMTEEDFIAERDFAYGIFSAQILVPSIVRALANSEKILNLVRHIKNAGAIAAAPVSGGLSIGAALATEAGFAAFRVFLGSDMVQNWLADWIMSWVKGVGWVGTGLVDGLWNLFTTSTYAEKLEKDKINTQNNKALATATTPQQRQAAQQAIDKTTATQTRSDDQNALLKQLK